ncbi:hypothetical protein O3P69_001089 [Scylla paramamosain]|uniref:VWFC domain-containing protein n=1 Tax=Scylla paramamosain TaxID=85552 RepID=A0AAW0USR8_SCYPA
MAPHRECPSRWFLVLLVIVAAAGRVHGEGSEKLSRCEVRAEKCCKYPMFSPSFFECCNKVGCCPRRCMEEAPQSSEESTEVDSAANASPSESEEECKVGRVCCRFRPNTVEYTQCCERHQCRPSCHSVPEGCCYNKKTWKWGSVVEAVDEDCVDIKCAAERVDYWPYLITRLVIVPQTGVLCSEPKCGDCNEWRCVDETGMLREEGEKFYMGRCRRCECLPAGRIRCVSVDHVCPPLPKVTPRYCDVVRGLCCDTLNCSVERTCRDLNNQERGLYTTWRSDPCTTHRCTLAGIVTERESCSPMPHPNCMKEEEYNNLISSEEKSEESGGTGSGEGSGGTGSGEGSGGTGSGEGSGGTGYDTGEGSGASGGGTGTGEGSGEGGGGAISGEDSGGSNSLEEEFQCCPKWKCGLDCRLVRCSMVPPGEDCVEVYEPLACCPDWNCSGCMDRHRQYHPLGSVWHPTPCTTLSCSPLGIVNITKPCKPKPHDICFEEPSEDGCCPVYNCGGCVDEDNIFHPMFSKWKVTDCNHLACTTNGIIPWEPECPPKPHENCRRGPKGLDCCPEWECGLDCRVVRCAGPPHSGCIPHMDPAACCPSWECKTCVDEEGRRRPLGNTWRTDDPCTNKTCTETGVVMVSASCALSSPPREGCFKYTPEGECCPRWNCSGCLDDNGIFHRIFEAWSSDACTRHFCASSGIITQELECPPLGRIPHPNCVTHLEPGECCSRWKCGPDCRLVFCPQRPEGNCTSHRPPLACCDQYECSGCTDDQGRKRSPGDTWFTPPCYLHVCRNEGVVTHDFCDTVSPSPYYSNLGKRSAGFDESASGPESKKAETAGASPPEQAPAPE